MLLNSPQLVQYSEALAARVGDPTTDPAAAIDRLWMLAYARFPEPSERAADARVPRQSGRGDPTVLRINRAVGIS